MSSQMEDARFTDWVTRYRDAWETNDEASIGALFTDEAEYLTEPYAEPWIGRDAIVRGWLDHLDPPGSTQFSFEVIATRENLGLVKGETLYNNPPREYVNLWEVQLAPRRSLRALRRMVDEEEGVTRPRYSSMITGLHETEFHLSRSRRP